MVEIRLCLIRWSYLLHTFNDTYTMYLHSATSIIKTTMWTNKMLPETIKHYNKPKRDIMGHPLPPREGGILRDREWDKEENFRDRWVREEEALHTPKALPNYWQISKCTRTENLVSYIGIPSKRGSSQSTHIVQNVLPYLCIWQLLFKMCCYLFYFSWMSAVLCLENLCN